MTKASIHIWITTNDQEGDLPQTPSNPILTVISASQINLTWIQHEQVDVYIIQRSTDNINWETIATPSILSCEDNELEANTIYYYRVQAVKGLVPSLWSGVSIISTFVKDDILLQDIRCENVLDVSADILVQVVNLTEDYTIKLLYGEGLNLDKEKDSNSITTINEQTIIHYELNSLEPYTKYNYKVLVFNKNKTIESEVYELTTSPPVELTDGNWSAIYQFDNPKNVIFNDAVQQLRDDSQNNELGSELVVNGDFSNGTAGWVNLDKAIFIENGKLRFVTTLPTYTSVWCGDNQKNEFRVTEMSITVDDITGRLNALGLRPQTSIMSKPTTYTFQKISTYYIGQVGHYGALTDATVSKISQKFILGNHLVQPTSMNGPKQKEDSYFFDGISSWLRTHNQFNNIGTVYATIKTSDQQNFYIENDLSNFGEWKKGCLTIGANSDKSKFYKLDLKQLRIRSVSDSPDTVAKLNKWFMRENNNIPSTSNGILSTGIWNDSGIQIDSSCWNDGKN